MQFLQLKSVTKCNLYLKLPVYVTGSVGGAKVTFEWRKISTITVTLVKMKPLGTRCVFSWRLTSSRDRHVGNDWSGWFCSRPQDPERTRRSPIRTRPGNPQALYERSARVLGPRPRNHLVSILPALSNETWPVLEKKWIMGPSINTIFPPLKLHTW